MGMLGKTATVVAGAITRAKGMGEPDRSMLGADQHDWLVSALEA